KHAVNAISQAQFLFKRLNMDVARTRLDGARNNEIHHSNHGHFRRQVAQVLDVFVVGKHVGHRLDQLFGTAFLTTVKFFELLVDLGFRGNVDAELIAGPQANGGLSLDIERIGHDERQNVVVEVHRYHMKGSKEAKRKLRCLDRNGGILAGKNFDVQL